MKPQKHLYFVFLSDLEEQRNQLNLELKRSKLQRNDSYLKKQTDELLSEMEVLQLENRNLKEMIREKDDILDKQNHFQNEVADDTSVKSAQIELLDGCSHKPINAEIHSDPETRVEYV